MSEYPTLNNYLTDWASDSDNKADIAQTIETIAEACIEISALVARGPLAGELGAEQGDNADGDTQKALDLIANDLIIEAIQAAPVACLVSEELEEPFPIKKGAPLYVATDPLDGSSNIDTNVSAHRYTLPRTHSTVLPISTPTFLLEQFSQSCQPFSLKMTSVDCCNPALNRSLRGTLYMARKPPWY
jgi:hypothetical protein